MENITVAGTDVVEYVTKTEEALMTTGNPANSTSTAAIAPDVDRHGTFVAPNILEATTGAEGLALTQTVASLVAKGPFDVMI